MPDENSEVLRLSEPAALEPEQVWVHGGVDSGYPHILLRTESGVVGWFTPDDRTFALAAVAHATKTPLKMTYTSYNPGDFGGVGGFHGVRLWRSAGE